MDFTDNGRQTVYDANEAKNGGTLKCDYCGRTVERRASRDANGNAIKGLPDDAQIDHEIPKAQGGCGADGEKTSVRREIRIVNTPFFARGVSFGDLIQVRPDNDRRELIFEEFTQESGHSTIRIIFLKQEGRGGIESRLRDAGCSWELTHSLPNYMAVDVPPVVEYGELREWLVRQVGSGEIEIQESAISMNHRRQAPEFL